MSIITVQVGQCGNQIGEKLYDTIVSDCFDAPSSWTGKKALDVQELLRKCNLDYVEQSKRCFFDESNSTSEHDDYAKVSKSEASVYNARTVLIDMESKVVNKLIRRENKLNDDFNWKFRDTNSHTQKKGSGNNWSYGYCINGPKSEEKIMDIIRREVERADRLSGFLVCSSLAGGTGSGVGAFCTETLRHEYPRSCIVNPVVWPYTSGEVILQNYNAVLTLAKLYEYSDALILFENDQLHEICTRMIDAKKVSFDDLNTLISHKLATILQPAFKNQCTQNGLDEIVLDMCAQNDYKLLTVNNVPQLHSNSLEYSSYQWPPLYKQLKHMLITGWFMEEGLPPYTSTLSCKNKSIAASLFSRGLHNDPNLLPEYFPRENPNVFVNWNPFSVNLWNQKREFNKYNKSLTLLSNSQAPIYKIDKLVQKAWKMFTCKAYVHQYLKYGYDEESFLNSFLSVEQIIKHYSSI